MSFGIFCKLPIPSTVPSLLDAGAPLAGRGQLFGAAGVPAGRRDAGETHRAVLRPRRRVLQGGRRQETQASDVMYLFTLPV